MQEEEVVVLAMEGGDDGSYGHAQGSRKRSRETAPSVHAQTRTAPHNEDAPEAGSSSSRKCKIAIFLAYCGFGFQGMQRNPGAFTVEGVLEEALSNAGACCHQGDLKKLEWTRAARTDKGVSAACQVVSGLFSVGEDGGKFVNVVNSHLPQGVRVLGYARVAPSFSAYALCEQRRYEYLLPTFVFDPHAHRDRAAVMASKGRSMSKCLECSERGRKVVGAVGNRKENPSVDGKASLSYTFCLQKQNGRSHGSATQDNGMPEPNPNPNPNLNPYPSGSSASQDNSMPETNPNPSPNLNHNPSGSSASQDNGMLETNHNPNPNPNPSGSSATQNNGMPESNPKPNPNPNPNPNASSSSSQDNDMPEINPNPSLNPNPSGSSAAQNNGTPETNPSPSPSGSSAAHDKGMLELNPNPSSSSAAQDKGMPDPNPNPSDSSVPSELKVDDSKAKFRFGEECRARFNQILQHYVGTHNFHSFTARMKAEDPGAIRHILSFECGEAFSINGVDFVKCTVVGRSFMLHQIRKMIGLAIAVFRGCAPESVIEIAMKRDEKMVVPTAPELGLYLDECMYPSYNQEQHVATATAYEQISQRELKDQIQQFKCKHIFPHIAAMEAKEGSMGLFLHSLNDRNYPDFAVAREMEQMETEQGGVKL